MDKQKLTSAWETIRRLRPWYLLVLALVSGLICVNALRTNNLEMVKLRTAVYTADKNNTNVQAALNTLQAYVTSHMNTDLSGGPNAVYPPIQLKYTYQRLEAAQTAELNNLQQANSVLYTQAQSYCQAQDPTDFSGHNRVPCIEEYISQHGVSVNLSTATIPASLYEYDFISPSWSPDLAGWSLVATILLVVLFVITWVAERYLRRRAD